MAIQLSLTALILIVAVALVFDFINGLHDAANSIATVVSTRVLPPKAAVKAWAAFFNFIAFLFFGLNVAHTVGTGIVSPIGDRSLCRCWRRWSARSTGISFTWWLGFPSPRVRMR